MNPNTHHQLWSKWTIVVRPSSSFGEPSFAVVKTNTARFMRKAFGAAAQMQVTRYAKAWVVEVIAEGHPVQDASYVTYLAQQFQKFFRAGFGVHTRVVTKTRLLAGDPQTGKPASQLVVMPPLSDLIADFKKRTADGERTL